MKTIDAVESKSSNHYLPALQVLVQNTIATTQQAIEQYQTSPLFLEPKHYFSFYYAWLEYVVNQKVVGDKENLIKLIRDTIIQNSVQGESLFRLMEQYSEQESGQIDHLVQSSGVIVVPVLKLIQFITDQTHQALQAKLHLTEHNDYFQLSRSSDQRIIDIFAHHFYSTIEAIKIFEINNPLIFTLENFSVILGWMIGFFLQLSAKPTEIFFNNTGFEWFVLQG